MTPRKSNLSAEILREKLLYDEQTGLFTWRKPTPRGRVGEVAGSLRSDGYVCIRVYYNLYFAHRLAWLYSHGEWPKQDIDHINGIKSDNRLANLRDVSQSTNLQNQRRAPSNSKTRLLGTHPHRRKFVAQITLDGRIVHLGSFETAPEGHQAYLAAKRVYHEGCTI